ncbi:MAG: peptide-methionine (S)-S-oxide reductase MsrA [Nitrospirota bacterium]|nr:peptide-methionine (S)-S-oxide reductase MsrA [Nitrospirota bacterium]
MNNQTDHGSRAESSDGTAQAMFGAGCFWGVQAAFDRVDGVVETAVGYAGGATDHPEYKQVCSGDTGHAEVVHVTFDPAQVSYQQLLNVFWSIHDPTQMNRQGPDVGTQYRTCVFAFDGEQEKTARASLEKLAASGHYNRPVATRIEPWAPFWRAEDYHQKYLEKRGLSFCH